MHWNAVKACENIKWEWTLKLSIIRRLHNHFESSKVSSANHCGKQMLNKVSTLRFKIKKQLLLQKCIELFYVTSQNPLKRFEVNQYNHRL
jgi:hypothetical protein